MRLSHARLFVFGKQRQLRPELHAAGIRARFLEGKQNMMCIAQAFILLGELFFQLAGKCVSIARKRFALSLYAGDLGMQSSTGWMPP